MKMCMITVGSLTIAQKAKRILSRNSIPVNLIKVDSAYGELGCHYGIEYPYRNMFDAARLLQENKIEYKHYSVKQR